MPVELKNVLRVEDPCGLTYYLGTLTPKMIKQLTFVPVVTASAQEGDPAILLNERPEKGYQRAGEAKRMEAICKFVKSRPNCLIPPVVLASRGKWRFAPVSKQYDHLGMIQAEDLAAIIDGQHRLGGLLRLLGDPEATEQLKSRPIPFMAVDELPEENEKQEFVVINDNQKGVKKSLIHYLGRDKVFAGQAAAALMEDEESVFRGRIDIQKKHDWIVILFGAAKECVELMYDADFRKTRSFDPWKEDSIQEAAISYVLEYWKAVRDAMPEYWSDMDLMPAIGVKKSKENPGTSAFRFRLLEETGIRAMSRLASELFAITWMGGMRAPSFEAIRAHLSAMAENEQVRKALTKPKLDPTVVEMDSDLKSTGKAGVSAIFRYLRGALQELVGTAGRTPTSSAE
jgi:DGQHR domain-containing protein